jgi:hypothetical protein
MYRIFIWAFPENSTLSFRCNIRIFLLDFIVHDCPISLMCDLKLSYNSGPLGALTGMNVPFTFIWSLFTRTTCFTCRTALWRLPRMFSLPAPFLFHVFLYRSNCIWTAPSINVRRLHVSLNFYYHIAIIVIFIAMFTPSPNFIIISLLICPLLGHRPSIWITHKENGP